jgi:hypothetical protein
VNVVNGQSFNHGGKNVNVVRRGFSCSMAVICHARVSVLPLDQAEYADQDKGACKGVQCLHRQSKFSVQWLVSWAFQRMICFKQGLRSFLERQLREVKAEIFEISGRYGMSSVTEVDARYRDGTLEEANSWRDVQRLDHLEHKRDCLLQLLEVVV